MPSTTAKPGLRPHSKSLRATPAPRAKKRAASAAAAAPPDFTQAHRRAASDELILHAICDRQQCRRHQACRGAGADLALYACWTMARDWASARAEQGAPEENDVNAIVADYKARVTRILAGLTAQDEACAPSPAQQAIDDAFTVAGAEPAAENARAPDRTDDDARFSPRAGPAVRAL